ncbi:uncharacterized protein LOC123893631 [Trifolium pratense]|uniref:uncharacterized protein LOC123893631 n=1 Tax=Trifolium pratense TaxID=57577 RepID=UPI001E696626|nr:uncharacterized protein LOC123893631 [Trifolium pratense]
MSLPPEIDDFFKQSIDHSLGLPISSQTLDIKLRASKHSEQILRDQNTSLLQKLKQKDQLIQQSKYEACVNALAIKKFVEENQKLAAECENLLGHCSKLKKECALYDNDREALIDFQNEAEERAREACLRAQELERDLVMYQLELKKCRRHENESVDSSASTLGVESLLDSLLATVTTKDESSTYEFLVANSENEHCKKLLSMWNGLKQSTRRVLSLVAELMSLEKDKEHLRINLDRAEEEGKLLSVENSILEKENRRLVMKYKERSHTESGGKLTNSTSAKSNKRKSSSKTSSSMAKKVDFDDLDSVSPRQALSPLQSN